MNLGHSTDLIHLCHTIQGSGLPINSRHSTDLIHLCQTIQGSGLPINSAASANQKITSNLFIFPHKWLMSWRSEVLRSLRHYLQAQSQRHHTINCLEKQSMKKSKRLTIFLERQERTIVNQTDTVTVSKAMLGTFLRDRVECIRAVPSA